MTLAEVWGHTAPVHPCISATLLTLAFLQETMKGDTRQLNGEEDASRREDSILTNGGCSKIRFLTKITMGRKTCKVIIRKLTEAIFLFHRSVLGHVFTYVAAVGVLIPGIIQCF